MNIRKLPSGSYLVRQQFNGKRYNITFNHKPTQKEITTALSERLETECKAGSFKFYAEKYVKEKSNVLSPSTLDKYEHMTNYFTEKFQNIQLSEITQDIVTQEINSYAETHSPKSVKNLYGFITAICRLYRPKLYLSVTLPQPIKKIEYLPTTEDVRAILNRAKGEKVEIPLYLATLGLRRSEIMAVTYKDLSDDNWLLINKARVNKPKGGLTDKVTKTEAGTRQVPVPKEIADLIREQKYEYKNGQNYILRTLHKYQDELGIPQFKLHSLRKHFASIGTKYLGKSDAKVVGGWSSETFMESVYWYSLTKDDELKASIEKMYDKIKNNEIEDETFEENLEYLQKMVTKMVTLLKKR